MFTLHKEYLSINYCSSSIFSISFLTNYFLIKVALTLPIIVIYKSGGLWNKIDFYQEQPDIKFKHDLFLYMEFEEQNYFWTNLPAFKIDTKYIKIPSINNIEYDHNDDNLNDELKLNLNIRSANQLKSIRCLLAFDFKVKRYIYLSMEGLLEVKIATNANNRIIYTSSINFKQKTLLDANQRTLLNDIFRIDKIADDVDEFITNYKRNNYTIDVDDITFEYRKDDELRNAFDFQLRFHYPQVITFQIKPKFWYVIKQAFIQYLAIFAVVYMILRKIRQILFEDQLLDCDVQLSDNFYQVQRHLNRCK